MIAAPQRDGTTHAGDRAAAEPDREPDLLRALHAQAMAVGMPVPAGAALATGQALMFVSSVIGTVAPPVAADHTGASAPADTRQARTALAA